MRENDTHPDDLDFDPFDTTDEIEVQFGVGDGLDDKIEFEVITGVQVPYLPSERVTILHSDNTQSVRNVPPVYVVNLLNWEKNQNPHTLAAADLSARKEMLLSLNREAAFRYPGYEAPIAISTAVPSGHVALDGDRIILNHMDALNRYIDADGDRAVLLFNKDRSKATLVKFPVTMQPLILNVMLEVPLMRTYDFTHNDMEQLFSEFPIKTWGTLRPDEPSEEDSPEVQELKQTALDEWDAKHWHRKRLFMKKHKDLPVGLLTNAWNVMDLLLTKDMAFEMRLSTIFNTFLQEDGKTLRAVNIENDTMKSARKDGNDGKNISVLVLGSKKALSHRHAWALTSASAIGGMRSNQLEWVMDADFDKLMADEIRPLNVTFRDVKPTPIDARPDPFVFGKLIKRLKAFKLINWVEYPHSDPSMPPSVMFLLQLPDGTPVALTDVKRENNRSEGLTFAFLMAPVYDNVTIYNADGSVAIPPSHKFVHPVEHLSKIMTTFDNTIRPYTGGEILGYFPDSPEAFRNPKFGVKVNMLQKRLIEYCGIYGDPCPAYRKGKVIQPSSMAYATITRSVVVDYGRDMATAEEMYEVAMEARKLCNFNEIGSKGTDRRIRKYMLANDDGYMVLNKNNVHPQRPGASRAQLQRALKPVKLTVAVIKQRSANFQALITPSGIDKQQTSEAFLPQVFSTQEAYENHLKGHYGAKDEATTAEAKLRCPADVTTFYTWTGEKRVAWVIRPNQTIRIGKLVDTIGNKFMPMATSQWSWIGSRDEQGGSVDLLLPVEEIADKYNHHAFLEGAVERTIISPNGETVVAMVVTRTFYRTGSASENIPPRPRMCAFKGMDMYAIYNKVNEMLEGTLTMKPVNTSFAKALQAAMREILRTQGGSRVMEELDPKIRALFRG